MEIPEIHERLKTVRDDLNRIGQHWAADPRVPRGHVVLLGSWRNELARIADAVKAIREAEPVAAPVGE